MGRISLAKDSAHPVLSLGGALYYEVLEALHGILKPQTYFEIGTWKGGTLRLAQCRSVAVDPQFMVEGDVIGKKPRLELFQQTSDAFFAEHDLEQLLGGKVDLAFLDGMHLFEFLLRDFFNTEKHCRADSVIVLHDCAPCDHFITTRSHADPARKQSIRPNWWTGDVWKMVPILRKYRPELKVFAIDAAPTGLVLITGLDAKSDVLEKGYERIVAEFMDIDLKDYGLERLERELSLLPAAHFMDPAQAALHLRL